jgi:hypothetical protein
MPEIMLLNTVMGNIQLRIQHDIIGEVESLERVS